MQRVLVSLTTFGLAAGALAWLAGDPEIAGSLWLATTAVAFVPLTYSVARDLMRGETGVDLIALLAMAGAIALGEYLAGAIIALMLTGGQALEDYASRRASRELRALVDRAPRSVQRHTVDGLETVDIELVELGDMILVRQGDVVPVDGVVAKTAAVLDESALTGESVPVTHPPGDRVLSGTLNAGGPFDLRAAATSEDSTYAAIVRLVEEAQSTKAPFVRLADRYALFFLPLTLGFAGLAWAVSGDPVRALAVMVVATPCPLILAAPVAIVAGISRSAHRGLIVKGGGALEELARAQVLLFDKTGTLTGGSPTVSDIRAFGEIEPDELLRLAASLDQVSPHVLAEPIAAEARARGLDLAFPYGVHEEPGRGISGMVEGRTVSLGTGEFVSGAVPDQRVRGVRRRTAIEGSINVFVSVDGSLAGALILTDPIRPEAARTIRALKALGITDISMLTGDHPDVANTIGTALGLDQVLSERSPAEKVEAVREATQRGVTVMVGDGINDAPALAVADVGVAMGARGASAASESADVVLTVDRIDRLPDAFIIARRSRRIALQSVIAGMAMSGVGMAFAAAGLLSPVGGALAQEAIDVAVILNALRALRQPGRAPTDDRASRMGDHYRSEHVHLVTRIEQIRIAADRIDSLDGTDARLELESVRRFLITELVPHEQEEDEKLYPLVAARLGGSDPVGALSRTHREIAHLVRLFDGLVRDIAPEGPGPDDLRDARRLLYGLHAVLKLHFAQEEDAYMLAAAPADAP